MLIDMFDMGDENKGKKMTGDDAKRTLRVFEAGCGKDVCDLAFALAKTAVRRHVASPGET